MHIIRDIDQCPAEYQGAVIAIGNFDGVHLGHQKIIRSASEIAKSLSAPLAVMTFEPHPREFFSKEHVKLRIYPPHQKLELLQACGTEILFMMRFNEQLANSSADHFITHVLAEQLKAKHIVTGYNFAFGKGRQGSTETLQKAAQKGLFGYTACDATTVDGAPVSSSAIRGLLEGGDVEKAGKLLGRPFSITGHVIPGAERGRTLGFHTANISLHELYKPRYGVYAVRLRIMSEGQWLQGIANIGVKPTFNPSEPILEVHIFDFDRYIYGEMVEVEFLTFIRPEECFLSVEALLEQIRKDIADVQAIHQKCA
jgi:riboflavin kinase / FMN adenylyltransferase